jgi:hypothetical protein
MGFNGTFFDAQDVESATITPATFNLRDTNGKEF